MPKTINQGFEEVPLSLLKPHPRNVNQADFGAIQESIEANGFYGAIVANKRTNHILAGNHRYAVAKQSHFDTIPVIWVDVDAEEELRIMLADNRLTRLGMDDQAQLAALLAELVDTDTGLIGTGFDGDDLDRLIGELGSSSIGLDSVADAERLSASRERQARDNGRNPDGSRYVICPECNHEFEIPR